VPLSTRQLFGSDGDNVRTAGVSGNQQAIRKSPPLGVLLVLLRQCKNELAGVTQGPQYLAIVKYDTRGQMSIPHAASVVGKGRRSTTPVVTT
jgi:hypothetical protein